jgi:hypothetical protein
VTGGVVVAALEELVKEALEGVHDDERQAHAHHAEIGRRRAAGDAACLGWLQGRRGRTRPLAGLGLLCPCRRLQAMDVYVGGCWSETKRREECGEGHHSL